jgi:hypothetical protein
MWHELCTSHYRGEDTSTYLISRSLMRPRNLLKIFNHCRGFATNFNRQKIEETDIEKGLKTYSADLLDELGRELTDVMPQARDLIYHFIDAPETLTISQLATILDDAASSATQVKGLWTFCSTMACLASRLEEMSTSFSL